MKKVMSRKKDARSRSSPAPAHQHEDDRNSAMKEEKGQQEEEDAISLMSDDSFTGMEEANTSMTRYDTIKQRSRYQNIDEDMEFFENDGGDYGALHPRKWSDVDETELDAIAEYLVKQTAAVDDEHRKESFVKRPTDSMNEIVHSGGNNARNYLQAYHRCVNAQKSFVPFKNSIEESNQIANKRAVAQAFGELSFNELEQVLNSLKFQLGEHTSELKQLVKDNFDRFIVSSDVVGDITSRFHAAKLEGGSGAHGATPQEIIDGLLSAEKAADRAYSQLIDRQEKIKNLQEAFVLFSRYEDVIKLPNMIREASENGKFESVVAYYKEATLIASQKSGDLKAIWMRMEPEIERAMTSAMHTMVAQIASPAKSFQAAAAVTKHILEINSLRSPQVAFSNPQRIFLDSRCSIIEKTLNNGKKAVQKLTENALSSIPGLLLQDIVLLLFRKTSEISFIMKEVTSHFLKWVDRMYNEADFLFLAKSDTDSNSNSYGTAAILSMANVYRESILDSINHYLKLHEAKIKSTLTISSDIDLLKSEFPSAQISNLLFRIGKCNSYLIVSQLDASVRQQFENLVSDALELCFKEVHNIAVSGSSACIYPYDGDEMSFLNASYPQVVALKLQKLVFWTYEEYRRLITMKKHGDGKISPETQKVTKNTNLLDTMCNIVEDFSKAILDNSLPQGKEKYCKVDQLSGTADMNREKLQGVCFSKKLIVRWSILQLLYSNVLDEFAKSFGQWLTKYCGSSEHIKTMQFCRYKVSSVSEALLQNWIDHNQRIINEIMEQFISSTEYSKIPPEQGKNDTPKFEEKLLSAKNARIVVLDLVSNLYEMQTQLLEYAPNLKDEIMSEFLFGIVTGLCDLISDGLFERTLNLKEKHQLFIDLNTLGVAMSSLFADIIEEDVDCNLSDHLKAYNAKIQYISNNIINDSQITELLLSTAQSEAAKIAKYLAGQNEIFMLI